MKYLGYESQWNHQKGIIIDEQDGELLWLEKNETGFGKERWVTVSELVLDNPVSTKELNEALRYRALRAVEVHASVFIEAAQKMPKKVIPASGKVIGVQEVKNMTSAAMDGWLTTGHFNDKFEMRLAARLGVAKVLTVNSGSSANLAALSALTSPKLGDRQLKPGDEVITAAAGFPTTINPIIQNRLVPVLVDSCRRDANIDVDQVEKAITPKTKAIMAAHTLGNPMNMKRLRELADQHQLWLIEDCCDALGSQWEGQYCGTFGDLATLSFYPAHHLTMGEGGAVFSKNLELMKLVESFRDWGRDCYCGPGKDNTCGKRFCQKQGSLPEGYDHKYTYSHVGYNLKITDMQAALGLAQMDRLTDFIQARKNNHAFLKKELMAIGFDQLAHIQEPLPGADPSWFGFLITLNEDCGATRREVVEYLEQEGIATRLLFAGNVTKQPYFKEIECRIPFPLTQADRLMNQAFWVGIWPGITEDELKTIALKLGQFFGLTGFD